MKNLVISLALFMAAVPAVFGQTNDADREHMARFLKNPADEVESVKGFQAAADETDLIRKPERDDSSTEASFTYSHQFLSNGRGTWKEATLDVVHKFSKRKVLYGSYLETERFDIRDRQASIGFYQPLNEKWTILLEAAASPNHRVLPKWSAMVQAERSLGNGWIAQAGYRRTEHDNAKVNIAKFGAEKYWGMNRAYLAFSVNNLEGTGTSPSQRFQYNRYYGENPSNFGVGFAIGREIENTGPNSVVQSNIYNITISGKHWFNQNWGPNYGFTFHKQGDFYNRRGLQFGLNYKF